MIYNLLRLSFFYFLLLMVHSTNAQVQNDPPVRQVLSSTGGSADVGFAIIDYTVGEVIVTTESTTPPAFQSFQWLTQGFQQPTTNALVINDSVNQPVCTGANNGNITFHVRSANGKVFLKFGNGNFDTIYTFTNLAPGDYSFTAKDDKFTISGEINITESTVSCNTLIKTYDGFTPNGDGINEAWVIEGITNFEKKTVSIFNRWGEVVWSSSEYNNVDDGKVWKGKNSGGVDLPAGTYFYLIDTPAKAYKGWVELVR